MSDPTACCDELAVADQLKAVLRRMPAPLGLVSCHDPENQRPAGLVMSALMPVCLEPSAMIIAVNRAGGAHGALLRAGRYCINLLDAEGADHLAPFIDPTRRGERFTDPAWRQHAGCWCIEGAPAAVFCAIDTITPYGTHDLIIGRVEEVVQGRGAAMAGWCNGGIGQMAPLAAARQAG